MIRQLISDFLKEEDGLVAVEYAVLAAVVITALAALTSSIGTKDSGIFKKAIDALTTANN